MNISTIVFQNKYNNNLSLPTTQKTKLQNQNVSDSFSFTGNLSRLSSETMYAVSSISDAYKDIMKKIAEKTPEGMEILEKEYKNFKSTRSLVFHNCGENNTSIQVRVPDGKDGRDFIKIVVKKGNSFVDDRVILDSFTIRNFDQLVEDNNKNRVYIFPDKVNILEFEKPVEKRLQNVLNDLDFAMLQFRKFLVKYDGQYLKPELFKFSDVSVRRLANIDSIYNKVDETLRGLPHKLSLKLKNEYGDYKLQAAQPVHVFKNIGENQNQIVYKKLNHPEHGELTRIMVYDKEDKIVDGFLIKDRQSIISNFNPKNFAIIPPKLSYYDKSSAKEILPRLEKYISDYESKLDEFNNFLAKRLYERSLVPVIGKLSGNLGVNMKIIDSTYQQIFEKFSSMSTTVLPKVKTSYPKWNGIAGQRGLAFKISDNEQISVLKMKSTKENNITRLCFTQDGEDKYFLINNDMVVKNYNPKYPAIIPSELKYYSDIELEELGLESFLRKAAEELQEFQEHVNTPLPSKTKPVKEKVIQVKSKPQSLSSTKEYKQLMKECNEKFSQAMKNAEKNMQEFDNVIQEIQSKIAGFFARNEQ